MKKAVPFFKPGTLFLCLISLVIFSGNVVASEITNNAQTDQCATFDFPSSTLHVPCLNIDTMSFWLDLELNASGFELKNSGVNGSSGSAIYCAAFDSQTSNLHIPYFCFNNLKYMLDMALLSIDPIILFDLKGFGNIIGIYSANGTYSYNPNTDILTTNITYSDFPAGAGPPIGITQFHVLSLTSTTMILRPEDPEDQDDLIFNRDSGKSGDPVGTWYMYDDDGDVVEATLGADGTISVVANVIDSEGRFFFVKNKTIAIDCDFSDWDDRDIVYVDTDGPDCNNVPGQDIQRVYVAQDENFIYVHFILNASLDETFGYKFGDNLHIVVRRIGGIGDISYWYGDQSSSGSFLPDSYVCISDNQFEFKVSKDDVKQWKDKDLNAWCDQGTETVCRDHNDLPKMDFGL